MRASLGARRCRLFKRLNKQEADLVQSPKAALEISDSTLPARTALGPLPMNC